MTTPHLQKSISRSPSRLALLLIPLVFACFALSQSAQGVVPPPDGGYPGGNTAEGQDALLSLTTGPFNTAVVWLLLFSNTDGSFNTAVGAGTLAFDIGQAGDLRGNDNTAVGAAALLYNISGYANTANGSFALFTNSTGANNTAVGHNALTNSTTGSGNTAVGTNALTIHTTGSSNTAVGSGALLNDTTGESNVAVGAGALQLNTIGVTNVAIGTDSGTSVTTANNVVCIGFGVGGANVDQTTWIGNIYGVTPQSSTTAPVVVSDSGQLGTVVSSERFKKDISTMEKASEVILSLRPVTFHYKSDVKDFPQFGLIAEEVAKVNPALVLPDKEGKPYTVRYDAVNAMLLNEFLKEHRKVAELTKEFQTTVAQQQKQIEALTTGLQKVSAQLEASKPAPRMVNNP